MNTEQKLTLQELIALTNGHPPHREDWTREMLPDGWRPCILKEKPCTGSDEFFAEGVWKTVSTANMGHEAGCKPHQFHVRTTRLAPPKAVEDVAKDFPTWWNDYRISDECYRGDEKELHMHEAFKAGMQWMKADLRTRLDTAEQDIARLTRERDEVVQKVHQLRNDLSDYSHTNPQIATVARAESAEAQLAEVRRELEEAQVKRRQHKDELVEIHQQLAAHTWVPTSERLPTDADANERGQLSWLQRRGTVITGPWNMSEKAQDFWGVTHFLPIPPLPTQPESEEELTPLEALKLILPLAKGYAHSSNVPANQRMIDSAEAVLQASREGVAKS